MTLKNLLTLAVLIALVAIEYLATTTLHIKPLENSWDKANHFVAFFVLYLLFRYSRFQLREIVIVSVLLLFGIQIEIVQYFIPGREFSALDVVADSVGIFAGILLGKTLDSLGVLKRF